MMCNKAKVSAMCARFLVIVVSARLASGEPFDEAFSGSGFADAQSFNMYDCDSSAVAGDADSTRSSVSWYCRS